MFYASEQSASPDFEVENDGNKTWIKLFCPNIDQMLLQVLNDENNNYNNNNNHNAGVDDLFVELQFELDSVTHDGYNLPTPIVDGSLEYSNGADLDFTDMTVSSGGGREFKCHRFLMASRSEVLGLALTADMAEGNGARLDWRHLDEEVVSAILEYAYSGCGFRTKLSYDQLLILLQEAHYLQMKGLVRICWG